jgi:hypothetical protein
MVGMATNSFAKAESNQQLIQIEQFWAVRKNFSLIESEGKSYAPLRETSGRSGCFIFFLQTIRIGRRENSRVLIFLPLTLASTRIGDRGVSALGFFRLMYSVSLHVNSIDTAGSK